ncbi:hypothetical protein [Streptomyces sp. NPDC014006]|uniref:hypothetical protein n=1 Tax=Streptomyces sp. NPDC014006 TaxID=3364870 RepID=UPI0036F852E9
MGLLTAVPWLCAIAAVYVSGRLSDRLGRRRPVLVALLLLGGAGTLLAVFVSPWLALGALCLGRHGVQAGVPRLLDDPAELPRRAGRRARHRPDQLHRKPGRVRRADRLRAHRGLDGLDEGGAGRPHPRRFPRRAERAVCAGRRPQRPAPREGAGRRGTGGTRDESGCGTGGGRAGGGEGGGAAGAAPA